VGVFTHEIVEEKSSRTSFIDIADELNIARDDDVQIAGFACRLQ